MKTSLYCVALLLALLFPGMRCFAASDTGLDATPVTGWQMQYGWKVSGGGEVVSRKNFHAQDWYTATVPGTVLTTLVNNHVYPEPLYGENNRPETIPDSLARTPFWYRTVVAIPKSYGGRHIWLNFDGINYSADVWVNGTQTGTIRGAFLRGNFDISKLVKPGGRAVVAVLVSPQPHPGVPHEHTLRAGMGPNGGVTALDGPTFLSTIGWDWIPAIRDRDTGIWRKVYLSATGPVRVTAPVVTTQLEVPSLSSAGITVKSTLENLTDKPQAGTVRGAIGEIAFSRDVQLPPHSTQTVSFDPTDTPVLRVQNPRVWWPNGYGPQNLYKLHIGFTQKKESDAQDVTFGIRKVTYAWKGVNSLAFVVNGVPVFIRGGDWGMDEAMKRIPYQRLDAMTRMHKLANLNMIRNWVGQSTSEEFYELCDKYGLLVWDEFFQPNPLDGPNPDDIPTYLANVKDKVIRFRNHPSIVLWCARNEGDPPPELDRELRTMLAELDPTRLYQANSSDGRGVRSHGPYRWRVPLDFFVLTEGFKSETGSMSVPTLESIQGMMPEKDWSMITDDWAEHDFARGNGGGESYPEQLAERYGKIENLADFVRKAQLADYEAFHAMYEGRNAQMFKLTTGIMTWMTNPAQPSFVWQIYHYDLEPNSAFFAVQNAAELVHVQFDEAMGSVEVINNRPDALAGAVAHVTVFDTDGSIRGQQDFPADAAGSAVTTLGQVHWPDPVSSAHFIELRLIGQDGKLLSRNFYWHRLPESANTLVGLNEMPPVELTAKASRTDENGASRVTITLTNPTQHVALMTHLQLHEGVTGKRVLPAFYSDNYVSLAGGETATVTIDAATSALGSAPAVVQVDGWNVTVAPASEQGISVQTNANAQVDHWPKTGLPFQTTNLR